VAAFVEVPLPDGGALIVEQGGDEHVIRAGRVQQITQTTGESFESALDRVKHAAMAVREKLQDVATPPDEVVVEFAIKLAAEIGVVVASSSAEANLKLTMRWVKSEASNE